MSSKKIKPLSTETIEKLLRKQTTVILDVVDEKVGALGEKVGSLDKKVGSVDAKVGALGEKVGKLESRFNVVDQETLDIKKRLDLMEMRINQKIDRLMTTLDKFLKKITDMEDEFTFMKAEIKRIKSILQEKLGVTMD